MFPRQEHCHQILVYLRLIQNFTLSNFPNLFYTLQSPGYGLSRLSHQELLQMLTFIRACSTVNPQHLLGSLLCPGSLQYQIYIQNKA